MVLTQILPSTCMKVPLEGTDKKAVITELVDLLETNKMLHNKEVVLDMVLRREQMRSTGIGSGVAIAHGRCGDVKELVAAMGVTKEPVEYGSIDGKPVKIVIMLVSPSDEVGPLIKTLGRITEMLLDENLRVKIEETTTAEQLYALVSKKEIAAQSITTC